MESTYICFLQVHLWTFEEEASHPGYSSTSVSEGCRSNCRLKGGVCACVFIFVYLIVKKSAQVVVNAGKTLGNARFNFLL